MLLISSKLEILFHPHETKMQQCLPYFFLCTCPFEKATGRHTEVCWKTSKGFRDIGLIHSIYYSAYFFYSKLTLGR